MKRCALLVAFAALCLAGSTARKFTGVIHDNRCVGPNCARQCPITKDPKYTLQSGDDAWVLSDQKAPAQYVGKRVIITGTLVSENKLKVISIAPAK